LNITIHNVSPWLSGLKSIKYTGTPENIKEIEDLVSSWDYSEVNCKEKSRDFMDYFSLLNCDPSTNISVFPSKLNGI
jgi:hypothetical protein